MCGVRKCSSFILLQVVDQFSQHHLLKRLSFLHCIFLPPLSKINQTLGLASWSNVKELKGTWVPSLFQEDSTCRRATKPSSPNYGGHTLQLLKPMLPRACAPQEEPPQSEARALQLQSSLRLQQLEKAHARWQSQK